MTDPVNDRQSDDHRQDGRAAEGRSVKVTDRRMFTPDGRLRDEYSFLEDPERGEKESAKTVEDAPRGASAPPREAPPPEASPEPSAPSPSPGPSTEDRAPQGPPLEMDLGPSPAGTPTFVDLLSILAEPVAIYLGDVELPDGRSAENLDAARLHIDLIDILRQKTVGNLSSQEAAVLEDLLYRLRMRYVQKRG